MKTNYTAFTLLRQALFIIAFIYIGQINNLGMAIGKSTFFCPSSHLSEHYKMQSNNLSFQIVNYDCNTGILQYKMSGGDGSPINLTLPGIFAGTVSAEAVATHTFPSDARVGRTTTGYANQSGNQISISFTTSCNLSSNSPGNPPTNPPTNPSSGGSLAFQIVGYDCNSGVLQYQITGGDGSPINLTLPGIFAGAVPAGSVATHTFPNDARIGRTTNGYANQSGNQISINFTTSCNLSTSNPNNPPTYPPTNPPSGSSMAFQIVSYDCNSGVLQYKMTGGDGSPINLTLPGVFAGTVSSGAVASHTFPSDARTGRTVTGSASQSGNQISISFTTSCNLSASNPGNPPTNPNPPTGDYRIGIQEFLGTRACLDADPNRSSTWNWTDINYNLYYSNNQNQPISLSIRSPYFYDASDLVVGTNDPSNEADMFPEDGWMLVSRDFGTSQGAPVYPHFILYNKYRGTLRVHVLRTVSFQSAYQTIAISLTGSDNQKPKLFTFSDNRADRALYNNADVNWTQTAVVKNKGLLAWMVADFDASGYDPQIDDNAVFNIRLSEVSQFDANLEEKLTLSGTAQPNVNSSGSPGDASVKQAVSFSTKTLPAVGNLLKSLGKIGASVAIGDVFDLVKAGGEFVSALIGGGGNSQLPYKINLTGLGNLTGTLRQASPADNISLYLKSTNSNYCYRTVQNIPWGVIRINSISASYSGYKYAPNPEQDPNSYFGSFNNFNVNLETNPQLPITITSVRARATNGSNDFVPLNQFVYEVYPLAPNGTSMQGLITLEITLHVNSPTRRLGSEIKIFRNIAVPLNVPSNARIAVKESPSLPYPNPSSGQVVIPFDNWAAGGGISIIGLDNKLIWSSNLSGQESSVIWTGTHQSGQPVNDGMYLIKIQNNDRIETHKVLIKR